MTAQDAQAVADILDKYGLDAAQAERLIQLLNELVLATTLVEQLAAAGVGPDRTHQLLRSWQALADDLDEHI